MLAPRLQTIFGDGTGGPFIDGDTVNNRIIVRGSRAQILAVKMAIYTLDR